MAVAQVSLNFLSRSSCAAQALAAASPRILSATPKSVCGSPTGSPHSFLAVATPKTPARSPFSTSAGGASPFFGAASPVWSDFEMAARASAEASAQLARVALPSAMSARDHFLARMGRRGSSTDLCKSNSNISSTTTNESSSNTTNHNKNNKSNQTSHLRAAAGQVIQPRLGLGGRGGATQTSGSGEFRVQLPVMLGNTRNQPPQVLRKLYVEEDMSEIDDAAKAAALVHENFMRRRAIIAERTALMSMP